MLPVRQPVRGDLRSRGRCSQGIGFLQSCSDLEAFGGEPSNFMLDSDVLGLQSLRRLLIISPTSHAATLFLEGVYTSVWLNSQATNVSGVLFQPAAARVCFNHICTWMVGHKGLPLVEVECFDIRPKVAKGGEGESDMAHTQTQRQSILLNNPSSPPC